MEKEANILSNLIKRRRSIFPASYTRQDIPKPLIQQILESANYAPTHKLTEPWRFIIFKGQGKEKLGQELVRLYQLTTPKDQFLQKKSDSVAEKINQANCVIILNAQLHPEKVPEWEELASLACGVQNMALTAEALNIGAYWSSTGLIHHLGDFLDLNDNEKCFGLFYMGYHHDPPREAKRSPMEQKVKWIES